MLSLRCRNEATAELTRPRKPHARACSHHPQFRIYIAGCKAGTILSTPSMRTVTGTEVQLVG